MSVDNDTPEVPANEKPEKTMAERAKEVGRDRSYLECDARDLIKALKNGDLQRAKIVVITSARIELSDPSDLDGLAKAVQDVASFGSRRPDGDSEYAGLNDEQTSLLVLRNLLCAGMSIQPEGKQ